LLQSVANALKLKGHPGKALRQGIVRLVRQPFPLLHNRASPPLLRPTIEVLREQTDKQAPARLALQNRLIACMQA
jgi:hypothetical protein